MVRVYTFGIVHCSVCAPKDMPREQVETETNLAHPTGLDHGWKIAPDKTFKDGEPNPCPCNDTNDCQHWLMVC